MAMKLPPAKDVGLFAIHQLLDDASAYDPDKDCDGTPLFTEEDVQKSSHQLTKLLRRIFVDDAISRQYLTDKYGEYARVLGEAPSRISSGKGNLINALQRPEITIKKFHEILVCILGYQIDLGVTVTDKRGKKRTYAYSAINK